MDNTPNTRVILDVRHCKSTDPAGEAKVAVAAALELRERCSGVNAFIYDGALRSLNIDPLVKAGFTVVSPPRKNAQPRLIRAIQCKTCHEEHYLGAHKGWLCLIDYLDDVTETYSRLEDRKVTFNARANGAWVSYVTATLPCGGTHRERLDATDEDIKRGFKRTEYLRQQPKGTPAYGQMYGWRADTESTHNTLDTGMYRNRMIVDKLADQQLVMIGHALARNAIAAATARAHTALGPPATARAA